MKALPVALAICVAFALTSSFAEAKQTNRHKKVKPAPVAEQFKQQPARMIEVKPRYWMSSYGCTIDNGYGRITPCDLTDHSD